MATTAGRKYSAALIGALLLGSVATVTPSATAAAEVCGSAGGPYANVDGCIPNGPIAEGATILGSVAVADAVDEWHQRLRGQPPCFTPQGVPYYTPGNMPCA